MLIMKIKDLIAIGQYLYGQQWQSPLARDLKIGSRTVRGWLERRWNMRESIANEIYELAAERQLKHFLPVFLDLMQQHGAPTEIELSISDNDSKVASIHKCPWSKEADLRIKQIVAQLLTDAGMPTKIKDLKKNDNNKGE